MPLDWRSEDRPRDRDAASIWDMLRCSREIVVWLAGKTEAEFSADPILRNAVERCLMIIGEAARRLPEERRLAHPELPWRQIIGLRNMLAHEYQEINPKRVWLVAVRDVPALIDLLEGLSEQPSG